MERVIKINAIPLLLTETQTEKKKIGNGPRIKNEKTIPRRRMGGNPEERPKIVKK